LFDQSWGEVGGSRRNSKNQTRNPKESPITKIQMIETDCGNRDLVILSSKILLLSVLCEFLCAFAVKKHWCLKRPSRDEASAGRPGKDAESFAKHAKKDGCIIRFRVL